MQDIQKDFNSGKDIDYIKNGGSGYESFNMEVFSASIVKGGSSKHPLVNTCSSDTDILELTINGVRVGDPKKKISFKEYQVLKKDDKGNYKAYSFERFKGNDGTIVPGTLCHDILHAAYDFDDTQRQERESLAFGQKKLVGLKFVGEAKVLDNGSVIFLTDRRRLKDEEYRAGFKKEQETFEDDRLLDSVADEVDDDAPDFLKN